MNIYEFRDCIKYVFDLDYFNQDIYKVGNDIYIIYYDKKVIIKSKEPIMHNSRIKDYSYTNIFTDKEKFIDCLIWIKKTKLNNNSSYTTNEILYKLSDGDYINNLYAKNKEIIKKYDETLDPFNVNNDLFGFKLNELVLNQNISAKINVDNKRNYDCKFINHSNNSTIAFSRKNNSYSAKFFISYINDLSINFEHLYNDNQKDNLLFIVGYEDNKFRITYDLLHNVVYTANNKKKDILPIHIELLNEDLENVNSILKEEYEKTKKKVM